MSSQVNIDNIRVVLVNTSHPGNIGASARAMKNMGLNKLVLVNPEQFPSGVAVGRAVSAVDILESAMVVDSLQAAVKDCGLVIGASARSRKIPWPVILPDECGNRVVEAARLNRVALVFGREDSGLTNEELQLCHYHVQIPADSNYSSLNLAAAVMVICYELRRAILNHEGFEAEDEEAYWDIEKATGEQVELFYTHLEKVLIDLQFHDPDNPRQLMQRMRRLFGRIRVDAMEMNILRGILAHVEYHLQQKDNLTRNSESKMAVGEAKPDASTPETPQPEAGSNRRRKDFSQAAQNKRQPELMTAFLEQAKNNKDS